MRKSGTKISLVYYEYNELDTLARYLEKQAAKGWELTNKTGAILGFRRMEPKKVRISVELVYDNDNDPDNEEYISFCKAAGWDHIFSDGKMQIFSTEDMNAQSIDTEPMLKLEKIHKRSIFSRLVMNAIVLAMIGFALVKIIDYHDYSVYLRYRNLVDVVAFPIVGIMSIISAVDYIVWYRRAKKKIECGIEPEYKRRIISKIFQTIVSIWIFGGILGGTLLDSLLSGDKGLLIYTVIIFSGVLVFMIGFAIYQSRHNKDRNGTMPQYIMCGILILIVISIGGSVFSGGFNEKYEKIDGVYEQVWDDKLSVTLKDIGIVMTGYQNTTVENAGTFMLRKYSGYDLSKNKEKYTMEYDVFIPRSKKIYNKVLKQRYLEKYPLKRKANTDDDFGAKEMYVSDDQPITLLLYEDRIIYINTEIDLNSEQKKIIKEKLMKL